MKKHNLFILSLSSLLVLVGCGEGSSSSSSSKPDSETPIITKTDSVIESTESNESSVTTTESEVTKFAIHNGNENVTLTDINESAKEGDVITFGYKIKSGYEFKNEVKIVNSNNEEVAFTDNNDGTYTFTMPSSEVTITLATKNRLYKISKDEETSRLISLIKCDYSEDYLSEESTSSEEDIWMHNSKAEFSKTVKVYLTSNATLKPTGITIAELDNKVINLEEGSDFVSFVMPNKDVTIKVNTTKNTHPVTFNNSTHISLSLFSKIEGTYSQINEVVAGDEVYLKAISSEEKYKINEISYSYTLNYGGKVVNNKFGESDLIDGYYKLSVPEIKDGTALSFTVTEVEAGKFAGYSFVGEYFGTTTEKGKAETAGWGATDKVSIDECGLLTFGYGATSENLKTYYLISAATNKDKGEAIASNDEGKKFKFYYDGTNIIADSSFDNEQEIFTSSLYVGFRSSKDTPNYISDMYTGYYDSVSIDSASCLTTFQLYKKEGENTNLLYSFYVDSSKKEFARDNVTIEITEQGEYVKDRFNVQGASYNILVNGVVKYRLKQTGKASPARFILDSYIGEYKLEGETSASLILNGDGNGTYKGEACTYTASENTLVLKTSTKKVTITVDAVTLTYVVVSEEVMSNPLVGSTFTDNGNVSYDYYDEEDPWGMPETYNCTVTLFFKDASTCKLSWVDNGNQTIIPEGEYTYNVEGKTITIKAISSYNTSIDVSMTLSDDGTKLTFNKNVNYEEVQGQYLTKQ